MKYVIVLLVLSVIIGFAFESNTSVSNEAIKEVKQYQKDYQIKIRDWK